MATAQSEYTVDFPTLYVNPGWVEAHCVIPTGFQRGKPWSYYDWQLWSSLNHYRVKETAEWRPESPMLATAFRNRRSVVVGPQKCGKGPWSATFAAAEGCGPALFGGWAGADDGYVCADHGCGCGWEYAYRPGEAMGIPWPTALVQILATSIDQVIRNVYGPLKMMAALGPLGDLMVVGEEFARLANDGLIECVSSSAKSRLGNPITCAVQDEMGLYTKATGLLDVAQTQRRGAAGMGGRSLGTTNAWDPSENSDAQQAHESNAPDIFRFWREPPAGLSFRNKVERRRILRYVYAGTTHVLGELDNIDAEAVELLEKDPAQGERFYGNRVVYGQGSWMPAGLWTATAADVDVPAGTEVTLGFDGSQTNDWTALRAVTRSGHRFTPRYGPSGRPTFWDPAEWEGRVPRLEVLAAWAEMFRRYRVRRMYADPPWWQTELEALALEQGDTVVILWDTYRSTAMHAALERSLTDLESSAKALKAQEAPTTTHDRCPWTATHVANARKLAQRGDRYILGKPNDHQKIDLTMADTLAYEAWADAHAAGWNTDPGPGYAYVM